MQPYGTLLSRSLARTRKVANPLSAASASSAARSVVLPMPGGPFDNDDPPPLAASVGECVAKLPELAFAVEETRDLGLLTHRHNR